jgi:DNA-binding NtrC family response regulator
MAEVDIFVIDDERVIAQTLGIILRQAGYQVEVFHDPHVALQAMGRSPRLVLTDQTMPSLSGCSVASLFAMANPGVAVLVFSGALMECDLEWQILHRQIHSSRLLHKPLHPNHILGAVKDAIGSAGASRVPIPTRSSDFFPFDRPCLPDGVMRGLSKVAMIVG